MGEEVIEEAGADPGWLLLIGLVWLNIDNS